MRGDDAMGVGVCRRLRETVLRTMISSHCVLGEVSGFNFNASTIRGGGCVGWPLAGFLHRNRGCLSTSEEVGKPQPTGHRFPAGERETLLRAQTARVSPASFSGVNWRDGEPM